MKLRATNILMNIHEIWLHDLSNHAHTPSLVNLEQLFQTNNELTVQILCIGTDRSQQTV